MAKSIIAVTSVTPLVNKDQLVTKLGPAVDPTTMPATITDPLPASDFASADDWHIKSHREAYVPSPCRCWADPHVESDDRSYRPVGKISSKRNKSEPVRC
ncbi:MAG: hypothetical protein WDO13_12085 [Verrucomicrobiota bacterium]